MAERSSVLFKSLKVDATEKERARTDISRYQNLSDQETEAGMTPEERRRYRKEVIDNIRGVGGSPAAVWQSKQRAASRTGV